MRIRNVQARCRVWKQASPNKETDLKTHVRQPLANLMRSVTLHLNAALMHLDITLGAHLLHFRGHHLRISAEI